jgi:hypothetical protein
MRLALPLLAAAAYVLYRVRPGGRSKASSSSGAWPETVSFADDQADSPNAAERLKTSHLGGAFAGLGSERGAPKPALRANGPDDTITTGLPDLTRGA